MRTKASFHRNSRNLMRRSHFIDQKSFMPTHEIVKDNYIFFESTLVDICLANNTNLKVSFFTLGKLFISSKLQSYRRIRVSN